MVCFQHDSGDDWEALFVIVLLIRCLTHSFKNTFLPDFSGDYSVSFNQYVMQRDRNSDLSLIKHLGEYLDLIPENYDQNHIAFYCPEHQQFPKYDVIVSRLHRRREVETFIWISV
jgi:hypothetical protein